MSQASSKDWNEYLPKGEIIEPTRRRKISRESTRKRNLITARINERKQIGVEEGVGRGKGERAEEITGIVTNCQPYGDAKHVDRFFFGVLESSAP